MRGRKTALIDTLTDTQREELESWLRRTTTPWGLARRAQAILLLGAGATFTATAKKIGMRERHIRKRAKRFLRKGIDGLCDGKGRGRKPVFSPRGCGLLGQAGV